VKAHSISFISVSIPLIISSSFIPQIIFFFRSSMAVSSSSSSLNENSSSPFYLSNGDHPRLVLVSQPLTGPNYNTWRRSMIASLIAKNKMAFIDGSLPQPSLADEATFHAWTQCNNMIIAWILNSVSKEIASSVIYITTCA
jgi:hypothetical protein